MKLDKKRVLRIVKAALKEDIGMGDVTTLGMIPKVACIKASIVTNEDCVMCGMDIAEWIMNVLDFSVRFKPQAKDGDRVYKGKEVAFLEGHARAILTAERTMLNFMSFLSGIATKTRSFVEKTEKCKAKIYDTRKTIPLFRYLEKYAVRVGGGANHRFGLWDQALIKENHLSITKCLDRKEVINNLRNNVTKNIKIEVEVENLDEFKAVLCEEPDIIMLDNMSPDDARTAVKMLKDLKLKKKPILEVSGGITMDTVEEYAKTGVNRISVGALTDSIESVDMSLKIIS